MKEIDLKLNLDFEQVRVLDLHSLLNIFNVVVYELMMLAEHMPDGSAIESILNEVHATADAIGKGRLSNKAVFEVGGLKTVIFDKIDACVGANPTVQDAFVMQTRANLENIFNILDLRIRELEERCDEPLSWKCFACELLETNLRKVFEALVLNSKGRYGVTEDPSTQGANDYLIRIRVEGNDGRNICMPPVIQDVVRDLAANSRKYTRPGGEIGVRIAQDENGLEFEIRDTGIGIPEDEIPGIFRFGRRGSNVGGMRTMGGGFGLTKAYYIAQMFGGKMWMDSRTGDDSGTTILCRIPLPVPARQSIA